MKHSVGPSQSANPLQAAACKCDSKSSDQGWWPFVWLGTPPLSQWRCQGCHSPTPWLQTRFQFVDQMDFLLRAPWILLCPTLPRSSFQAMSPRPSDVSDVVQKKKQIVLSTLNLMMPPPQKKDFQSRLRANAPQRKKSRQSRNLIATLILHIDAIFFPHTQHRHGWQLPGSPAVDNGNLTLQLISWQAVHRMQAFGEVLGCCTLGLTWLGCGFGVLLCFFPLETLGQRVANKEFFMPLLKFIRSKLLLDYLGHLYRDNLTINLNMGHWVIFFLKTFHLEEVWENLFDSIQTLHPKETDIIIPVIYIQGGPFNVVLLPPCLPIHTSLQWWWFRLGLQVIRWCTFSQPVLEAWVEIDARK